MELRPQEWFQTVRQEYLQRFVGQGGRLGEICGKSFRHRSNNGARSISSTGARGTI